ncbi:MAG TPA: SurA N-terminal domain-containing protein [Thermoanaerobaculia bacterium]|nr:SurA N-terminal domain-containing protein [Thermoanaerobaculia bacterium]
MRKPTVLLIAAGLAAPALPAAELVEQIVVRVNDRLITQSEYDKRLAIAARAPNHPTDAAELERNVLEDLIKEKLLEERAKEMSVSATEEEVDAAVARIKEQYKLTSDADFDKALSESGMTREELRRQMRQSITLQKVVGRDVASQLQLTDDQLRLEYERKKEQFYAVPESAHVAEIVIRFLPSDGEGRQKAVEKVEEIRVKVKGGASFGELAKENSEGSTRDKGGELGTVSKGELVEALDAVIFVTPPEEYPAPALLPDSIHLFRVTDRKASGYKPFSEVKDDLRKRIQDDLYEKRFGEYMDKLRRDAFVKIYVPELAKLDEKKPT